VSEGRQDLEAHGTGTIGTRGSATRRSRYALLRIGFTDEAANFIKFLATKCHATNLDGLPGINIFRLRDGIVERWENLDVLGFLVQLGVIPAPAEA
jgi:hypothetical protein